MGGINFAIEAGEKSFRAAVEKASTIVRKFPSRVPKDEFVWMTRLEGKNVSQAATEEVIRTASQHPLIAKALEIRAKNAAKLGIDIKRLPEIVMDTEGILSESGSAAYVFSHNKIYLKESALISGGERLEELVPHEDLHAYMANLRTAWLHQYPKEVYHAASDVLVDTVRNGEHGLLVRDYENVPGTDFWTIKHMEAPALSAQERNHVADFLQDLFKNSKSVFEIPKRGHPRALTFQGKEKLRAELLPKLQAYVQPFHWGEATMDPAMERAAEELEQYINMQGRRYLDLARDIRPHNADLFPSQSIPFTPIEMERAKTALKGLISTTEGNLQVEVENPTRFGDFQYCFGAWEELLARMVSTKYEYGDVLERIKSLEAGGENPQSSIELAKALSQKTKLESDRRLLSHVKRYFDLSNTHLATASIDPQKVRAMKLLKEDLVQHAQELAPDDQRLKELEHYWSPGALLVNNPENKVFLKKQAWLLKRDL